MRREDDTVEEVVAVVALLYSHSIFFPTWYILALPRLAQSCVKNLGQGQKPPSISVFQIPCFVKAMDPNLRSIPDHVKVLEVADPDLKIVQLFSLTSRLNFVCSERGRKCSLLVHGCDAGKSCLKCVCISHVHPSSGRQNSLQLKLHRLMRFARHWGSPKKKAGSRYCALLQKSWDKLTLKQPVLFTNFCSLEFC